jgi:hypothetical protein
VLAEDTSAADDVPDSTDYTPLARPGCLAPHAWLNDNKDDRSRGASLYDHFETRGFTLLVTRKETASAVDAFVDAASEQGIPLKVLSSGLPALRELYGCDYALIRPDQYIAWCGDSLDGAFDILARVTGKSLEALA